MATGSRSHREYSEAERQAAVALTLREGPAAASRACGIPKGTLSFWAYLGRRGVGAGSGAPAGGVSAGSAVMQPTRSAAEEAPATSAASGPGSGTGAGEAVVAMPAPPPGASGPLASATAAAPASPTGPAAASAATGAKSRVARTYTPSQRAQAIERVAAVGVKRAARELGISTFSLRDWRRKAQQCAAGERANNPLYGSDADPADERDRRILAVWREHVGLGPTQVRNQLRRANFKVSVHTVRRVLEANGYVAPKASRRESHDRRFEAVRPNQLWHLDFVHRHIHKQPIYVLLLLDDFSRFIVGGAIWDAERVGAVIETFEAAVTRHGRPEAVLSDGGSAFWAWRGVSQFTRLLEELDIDQIIAKLPQTNGKLEALNANVHKEVFNPERFFDLGETSRRLAGWVEFYNLRRTNTALGGLLVPADRYFGRAERVLGEIEAGRPADGIGEPLAVANRELDLLRVTSRGGQVEVFLMGSRLWAAPAGR